MIRYGKRAAETGGIKFDTNNYYLRCEIFSFRPGRLLFCFFGFNAILTKSKVTKSGQGKIDTDEILKNE